MTDEEAADFYADPANAGFDADRAIRRRPLGDSVPLDLPLDLNTIDDTGLPWAFLTDALRPDRVVPGAYVVVGSGSVRAVASVVDVVDDIVHVRPLRGPISKHRYLLRRVS